MLRELIAEEIRRKGPISFCRFMELCLYHPEFGYYMKPRIPRGKGGDYLTAPTISPLFGQTLAKKIVSLSGSIPGSFELVEVGSGEGYLCRDILQYLRERSPEVYGRLSYISIELNPHLLQKQRELLGEFTPKVSFKGWEEVEGIRGIILCNELLDALPVHRVKVQGGKLWEVLVDFREGRFSEVLTPAGEGILGYFRWLGLFPPEGSYAEVGLSALRFIEEAHKKLQRGYLLLIDYGLMAEELFSGDFPWGTLLSYKGHRALKEILDEPGQRDITAHVNFSAVIKKAREVGFRILEFTTQGRFLLETGILEGLQSEERLRERLQAKWFILPQTMGTAFKVLLLEKEVGDGSPHPLRPSESLAEAEGKGPRGDIQEGPDRV